MKIFTILALLVFFQLNAQEARKKIALLFLTVEDLNHPNLWKKALKGNEDKFNLYFHSKEPMKDEYFKQFRISKIVPTSWSNQIYAEQALLQEAIKEKSNWKFIFLSEACVPLQPLKHIYKELIEDDQTYMSHGLAWWVTPERIVEELPEENRMVNQQWIILNRRHASLIAADNEIIHIVANYPHDTEGYPATFLSCKNELANIRDKITTYVNFENRNVRDESPYHFFKYDGYSEFYLNEALEKECYFARKFMKSFPESILEKLIIEYP